MSSNEDIPQTDKLVATEDLNVAKKQEGQAPFNRDDDDDDKKRKNAHDDSSWFGNDEKTKGKRSKKEAKANHTRRRNNEKEENGNKEPHAGSFANKEQRQLFNIELPPEEDAEITQTRVKRKVVFLLGYLGTNYTGFQINEGQRTLQGDFELALLRCNLLLRSNFGYPHKYGWCVIVYERCVHGDCCTRVCSTSCAPPASVGPLQVVQTRVSTLVRRFVVPKLRFCPIKPLRM